MAEAITVVSTIIHCDTCHHEFEGDPEQWLNKDCPQCGAEKIVNDEDFYFWKAATEFRNFLNKMAGDVEPSDNDKIIVFDTAIIRGIK